MILKDLHTNICNIIGLTMTGVLYSTFDSHWWSCGSGSLDVLRAWIFGTLGFLLGLCITIVTRHFKKDNVQKYFTEVLNRGLLVYAVIPTALLKAEGLYYNYSLLDGETKLADLEVSSFANAFYGFSPLFQAYIGYIILLGLGLICFRQSKRIGNIMLASIFINTVILNIGFHSCFAYKNSIYLMMVGYFIFNELPNYFHFFTDSKTATLNTYHPLDENQHLQNSSTILKIILLTGMYFYNQDYIKDSKSYSSRNAESPITGVWKVKELQFLQDDGDEKNKETIRSFNSIILDKGRYGAVKINDTLSFFEYLIIPDDNHLEIWNFQDYYDLDIKGRYHQVSEDSIVYLGRNNQDSLMITLKRADGR